MTGWPSNIKLMEETMLSDLRDALRQMRKAPGFTTTALITLALGIGATTAIFTLVQQVMLKSLPVAKPSELWRIGDKDRCCNWGGYTQGDDNDFALFSWEAYRDFRAHTPEFTDLAALQAGNAPLGVRREGSQSPADTRNGEYVSGNFFKTFGVQPWIGRLMTDDDDREGAPSVGADRGNVMKMVLRAAFLQVGIGLALGIPAAIGAGELMKNQLFGVKAWDPGMFALAALMLCLAALLASVIPARRAAGVEPMVALRIG
jgi:hypothetical protein